MTRSRGTLDSVAQRQPEWAPWLAVIGVAYDERANGVWDAAITAGSPSPDQPRMAGTRIALSRKHIEQLWRRLLHAASRIGSTSMRTLGELDGYDAVAVLSSSVTHDRETLALVAAEHRVDPESFAAVADLLAWPLLQACGRRWRSADVVWDRASCPVCGAWPAFAELRGIERRRFNRCGRCGSEWQSLLLRCVFCGLSDHEQLVSLVPAAGAAAATIEACTRCGGYLKTLVRLQGAEPSEVLAEDLASVHLDLAALEAGYARPHEPPARVPVSFVDAPERRALGWRS
jgi:FdhE protein